MLVVFIKIWSITNDISEKKSYPIIVSNENETLFKKMTLDATKFVVNLAFQMAPYPHNGKNRLLRQSLTQFTDLYH